MTSRVVVFDLDGTLIDSVRDLADATNEVLAALGVPARTVAEVRTMVGGGARLLLRRALGPPHAHRLEEARGLFKAAYGRRLTRHTRLYPGLEPVLERAAARGLGLAVATNKPAEFAGPIFERLRLERIGLRAWAAGDEVDAKKPDPAVVRLAVARAGFGAVPADRLTYVGDMAVDVQTARALGCRAVGVAWGFGPQEARAAGPDAWVCSAEGLEAELAA